MRDACVEAIADIVGDLGGTAPCSVVGSFVLATVATRVYRSGGGRSFRPQQRLKNTFRED
jgi:hypothetical protein